MKNAEYRVTNRVEEREKAEIFDALLEYNLERLKGNTPEELGVFLEEDGRRLAGLIGETHGNWLTVKYLWVAEAVRGRRVGSELLQRAEDAARERGCKYVFLDTFSFQAPGFYLKRGYKEAFTLEEYPLCGKRHYFTKTLTDNSPEKYDMEC